MAAYAGDSLPEGLLAGDAVANLESQGLGAGRRKLRQLDPVVLETLQGLLKLAKNQHLPTIFKWLKIAPRVSFLFLVLSVHLV